MDWAQSQPWERRAIDSGRGRVGSACGKEKAGLWGMWLHGRKRGRRKPRIQMAGLLWGKLGSQLGATWAETLMDSVLCPSEVP